MIQNPEVIKAKIDKTNDKLGISICHFLSQRANLHSILRAPLKQRKRSSTQQTEGRRHAERDYRKGTIYMTFKHMKRFSLIHNKTKANEDTKVPFFTVWLAKI